MKWKNYGLWAAIASVLYMVFSDLGIEIDLTKWQTYVTAILGILATLGIISSPEKGKGYFLRGTPQQIVQQEVGKLVQETVNPNNEPTTTSPQIGEDEIRRLIQEELRRQSEGSENTASRHQQTSAPSKERSQEDHTINGMPAPPNEYL